MTVLKRSREEREIEVLAMENCLMLLANVGKSTNGSLPGSDRVFACKTCNRKFPTFQALGGHRASHKRLKLMASDLSNSPAKPKVHECSICGLEFPLGQALGGHMRRHRDRVGPGFDSDKSTETEIETETAPVLEKSNGDRVVFLLDLNLTPYENDLKLA